MGGTKENRSIWDENRAQELILAVLNKELSLTAAAVRLGVDTTTFLSHLTDNGKNKQRLAQLVGPHLQSSVLGDGGSNVPGMFRFLGFLLWFCLYLLNNFGYYLIKWYFDTTYII